MKSFDEREHVPNYLVDDSSKEVVRDMSVEMLPSISFSPNLIDDCFQARLDLKPNKQLF